MSTAERRRSGSRPARFLQRVLSNQAIRTRVLAPFTFDALILLTNLVTGVIVARALGPSGRGQIAAILTLVVTATWLFALGNTESISYRGSRQPEKSPQLIGFWLGMTAIMGALAIVATQLLLPVLFSAQSDHAITLARIFSPVIVLSLLVTLFNGVVLADEDFLAYNLTRSATPITAMVGYLLCLALGIFTVEAALIANAAGYLLASSGIAIRSIRRHGIARPERLLMKSSLWYGMRAAMGSITSFINGRLDLLILPAFLSAVSVGLYSVATNVSSMIPAVTGTIAIFALPVATKADRSSARVVIRTMHATLAIGATIALLIAALADVAVPLVYGSDFDAAVGPMRVMLIAGVLDAGLIVLWSGLLAANRPFLSSIGSAPSAVLTIVGLLLFLESGGIMAAAYVTLAAYTVSFCVFVLLYRHTLKLRWREFLPPGPPADRVIHPDLGPEV